jgi:hypothetical protein
MWKVITLYSTKGWSYKAKKVMVRLRSGGSQEQIRAQLVIVQ